MASILLEPVVPNLSKISSGDHLRDLWRLFTKVKDCTQGGRRLENLYWRLWYQSTTTGGNVKEHNICNLLETWKEDGDQLNVAKFKDGSASSSPLVPSGPPAAPGPAAELKVPTIESSAVVAAAAPAPAAAVPPATPSITISRVSSALKSLAANNANVPAIPVAPAVPRSILPKKTAASKANDLAPSRVSIGFTSEKPVKRTDALVTPATAAGVPFAPTTAAATAAATTTTVGFGTKPGAALASVSSAAKVTDAFTPATAALPPASKTTTPNAPAKNPAKKKFFVADSDSFDSMEGELEESFTIAKCQQLQPPQPAAEANPRELLSALHQPASTFSKIEPEPEPRPSNLSNLLRAPRRVPNKFNLFAPAQNYRARTEDATQIIESESLRRCIQLDRKPMFDPSLGFATSAASFAATPPVW